MSDLWRYCKLNLPQEGSHRDPVYARACLTYAVLFVGLVPIYVPAQLLERFGFVRPDSLGAAQAAGSFIGSLGGLLALWCVLTFALMARGARRRLTHHGIG